MEPKREKHGIKQEVSRTIAGMALLPLFLFLAYIVYTLGLSNVNLEALLSQKDHELEEITKQNKENEAKLLEERNKNGNYVETIEDITNKVTTLEKITHTDKELLQKYSKVFFLNEHYKPKELIDIPDDYLYDKNRVLQIHSEVWPHLKRLLRKAEREGLDLKVASAYRSFETQKSLKSGYKVTYGAGTANQFSADQGYSEHQLGTTLDFTTSKLGGTSIGFKNTPEYKWLLENAYRYGFILSYPENNKYYVFEPWHWRFVGETLAEYLYDEKKSFYDMDQRDIDEYLVSIFD